MGTVFKDQAQNSAIAASGKETFITGESLTKRERYGPFNALAIQNTSFNDIQLKLDGLATRTFVIPAQSVFTMGKDDDEFFSYFVITDLSAAAIAQDKIYCQWSKEV